jgi:putative ABC transport system ATP-binding protein
MLRLEKVNKYYRVGTHSLHVLRDVDFHVEDGEFVSIMGASGSGKSTLLNILGILDDYDSGEYWLGDTLIRALSERRAADYRNRFIGFVFQSFNLLPFKTALENVALPLYYQGITRRKRNQIAAQYLERVGLRDWSEHLPSEMSGGQKQRVAIARALIGKPRLILADEPTGALDSETSRQIMDLLSEIHRTGITVLVVTHDGEVAARTQRTIRLKDGKVVGELEASVSNPRMAAMPAEPSTEAGAGAGAGAGNGPRAAGAEP